MKLEFQEYTAGKVVNVHKHVDGPWFWGRYTAHPYVGCRSGCEFCYLRGSRYLGGRNPDTFDTLIQVKTNAVELLKKELSQLPYETIACGDWQQPAEDRYQLSRRMLEVILDLGFPLFIVERSPLLTRDLDLLIDINRKAWVGVVFSMSSLDPTLKRAFEPRSPGVRRRLQAMQELASGGILVGTALMPVLPKIGDQEGELEEVVLATRDHGGSFVLGGGLTMDSVQAKRTLEAARRLDPDLAAEWREFYKWEEDGKPNYGPSAVYNARLGYLIRNLCGRHGLLDRMPRYIPPGPFATNKRIAERLFLRAYDLELEQASQSRIWAYRRAAWTVDELAENILNIYQEGGEAGLEQLPAIGKSLAGLIASWFREM